MSIGIGIAAILALILANGYFVAAEFAYVAARRSRLEELASTGDRRAGRAVSVLQRLSFMLSGAQLGITVTSLVVGAIAEPTLGPALTPLISSFGLSPQAASGVAFTVGFILATAVQMVLGELAPKNLALACPEDFALRLGRSTLLYTRLAGPLIQLFDGAANMALRLAGIRAMDEAQTGVSVEELGLIITQSGAQGTLTPVQTGLLSRMLEFRGLRASDAMVRRPSVMAIPASATCDQLRRLAVDSGHSRFPVIGPGGLDDMRGIVQAKDIFRVPAAQRSGRTVQTLSVPALVVPESALLGPLLADMRAARSQLAVVVDEHGGTAGIVTLEDVVEELVGEIRDEHDPAEPSASRQADGSWLVPGDWRVEVAARRLGIDLPTGEYDSLGGLLAEVLQRVPEEGDVIEVDNVSLGVEAVDGHAVAWIRVRFSPSDGPGHRGQELAS